MFRKGAGSTQYDNPLAVIRGMTAHTVAEEEKTTSKSRKSEII